MLVELRLKNFILVDELVINFAHQLTVLTGETGAGKSVIAGAIHLVLGEQVRGDIFYDKNQNVILEASFCLNQLKKNKALEELVQNYGLDPSVSELFFTREIKPDGRSTILINGRKSTNNIVKDIRNLILDFHSQRDQQSLFEEDTQLLYLDIFADLIPLRDKFALVYQAWEKKIKTRENYLIELKKNEEKILLYNYQVDELEAADLKENEEQELDAEYNLLSNAKDILEIFQELRNVLFESEKNIYDSLVYFQKKLINFVPSSKSIADAVEHLECGLSALNDLAHNTRYIEDEITIDESRLLEVEKRVKLLYDLKLKYKKDIYQLNHYHEEMKNFLRHYQNDEETEIFLKKEIDSLQQEAFQLATELHDQRCKAASILEQQIINSLKVLAIKDANFKIEIDKLSTIENQDSRNSIKIEYPALQKYSSTGFNRVRYLFSANLGTTLQELKATVSGGELSRLLLVIKSILAKKLPERTIIFDEIDSGIGGNTATMLGDFIKGLSSNHQILCISHLPQIAALADHHLKIEKIEKKERSVITVTHLQQEQKTTEIARMLSGTVTNVSLQHAEELLRRRKNERI